MARVWSKVVGVLALSGVVVAANGCIFTTEYDDEGPPEYEPDPCLTSGDPTPGELGLLEFVYDYGSLGCAFGCSADEPIAERAHVQITAVGDVELPPISVQSDAPEVATFEIGDDGDIHVETHAAGEVRLELRDESGELLEALSLEVKPVTAIALEADDERVNVMEGGSAHVRLELQDERGCGMVGVGGVDYSLEGGISESEVTLTDAIAGWLFEGLVGSPVTEYFDVDAESLGEGKVVVTAPSGALLDLPIAVVDASAVAAISLSASDDIPVGSSSSVSASATDADGNRIHDPACAWSLDPATGPIAFSSQDRDSAFVTSEAPGTATVRCDVGSASGTFDVVFSD
jgi:hypothetical protein